MSSYRDNQQDEPRDTEAYYETVASQEEIYLEEEEEEVRAILSSDNPTPSPRGAIHRPLDEPGCAELEHAAEDLITGDSDDPPLSDGAVDELLE